MKFPSLSEILVRLLAVVTLLTVVDTVNAARWSHRSDSLLRVLDRELSRSPQYEAEKMQRIHRLRNRQKATVDLREKFDLTQQLFREYRRYNMDTTVILSREASDIAERLGIDTLKWHAKIMEAEGLKGMGMYQESLAILTALPQQARDVNPVRYYNRFTSLYISLLENSLLLPEAEEYKAKQLAYRDSVMMFDTSEWGRVVNQAESFKLTGHPEKALELYNNFINKFSTDTLDNPSMWYGVLGDTYLMLGRNDEAVEALALASIDDIRKGIRNYTALQNLASILNANGDHERAFSYIHQTINDIDRSHARARLNQIADLIPIINSAYISQSYQNTRNQTITIVVVSILALILIVALMIIRKRNADLKKQHRLMDDSNARLQKGREEMTQLNENLADLNQQLMEANRIKIKYLGYLFNLCSEYIEQTEKYRKSVLQLLKVRKTAEAEKALAKAPPELSMKSFLREFDAIFLNLYPNFVTRFNDLLVPEARITPSEGELLTPELRIYALVRLGITDSTKIAAFLNYSPQTVYNYRQRMRNNACVPKTEFVEKVKSIRP